MEQKVGIGDLSMGERAVVRGFTKGSGSLRERLISMGLARGTVFIMGKKAPMGDPIEIEVRGYRLSLRKEEGDLLLIEREVSS